MLVYRRGQDLPSFPLRSFRLSDMVVRVYADSAVSTGLAEVESVTPDGKLFTFQMRFLNVWRQVGGGWKIVAAERTMVRPYTK